MMNRLVKNKIFHLVELIPFGHDLFLVLTKRRRGINYRGVFDSFALAKKAASCKKTHSYDVINSNKASNDVVEKQHLDTWFNDDDYPLLFWLSKLIYENKIVLELGGSLGHFFYSIQKLTSLPDDLCWTIAELPAAVNFGRTIASEREERRIFFINSDEVASVSPADIFMTAGTLQYMSKSLFEIIQDFEIRPKHVLIHNLPLHKEKSFYTLQNLGLCEVPYRIYSQNEILSEMDKLGYTLIADWKKNRSVDIPFYSSLSIEGYCGFYFIAVS